MHRLAHDVPERVWSKSSTDRAAFGRPLSELVAGFPVGSGKGANYYQSLRVDRVVNERVIYWSPDALATLEERAVSYLRDRHIDVLRKTSQTENRRYVNLSGETPDVAVALQLMYDASVGETVVDLNVQPY
jgi:hypothetical protein